MRFCPKFGSVTFLHKAAVLPALTESRIMQIISNGIFCGRKYRIPNPRNPDIRMWCLSTKAPRCYAEADFKDGDYLFFGKETKGLPEDFLESHRESCVRIPMRECARSLNLSNAVAITVFEALRQLDFPALQDHGKMFE